MLWTQSLVQAKVYGKEYCFVFKGDGRLLLLLSWSPSHLHLNCFHLVPFKDDCIKSRTYLSMFFYYGKKLNIFSKNNLHIVFVFIQRSWGGPKVQYGTIHKRCCPFYNFFITPFCQKYFTSIDGQMILTLSPHPPPGSKLPTFFMEGPLLLTIKIGHLKYSFF